jgi:hypothetical protein
MVSRYPTGRIRHRLRICLLEQFEVFQPEFTHGVPHHGGCCTSLSRWRELIAQAIFHVPDFAVTRIQPVHLFKAVRVLPRRRGVSLQGAIPSSHS